MKLSTRGRYGARALMELAKHHGGGPMSLKELAARQQIPLKYLEQIAIILKHAKLIKSTRGPLGGYLLTRPPDKIDLLEVVETLEGPFSFVGCVKDPSSCERVETCAFNELWSTISSEASRILRSVTLADMVRMDSEKNRPDRRCLANGAGSRSLAADSRRPSGQRRSRRQSAASVAKGSKSSRTCQL
ncbi:MAG: Rrf2 family transcriptional regulator [bacterium]